MKIEKNSIKVCIYEYIQIIKPKTKPMSNRITNKKLFINLAKYNIETNKTRFVNIDEFIGEYARLKCGNGGSWYRTSAIKEYKFIKVRANGEIELNFIPTESERVQINYDLVMYQLRTGITFNGNKKKIILLRIYGLSDNVILRTRPIDEKIRNKMIKLPCVVCGSNSDIVPDHKNDLYNDDRVLSCKTQVEDDFQPLCRHCNLQKREVAKKTRMTGKRYGATNIPQLKNCGIDFIEGDENYDPEDPKAMVGTYWYDPVRFMDQLSKGVESTN